MRDASALVNLPCLLASVDILPLSSTLAALQLEPIPGFEPGPADPGEMEQLLPVLNGTTPTNGG